MTKSLQDELDSRTDLVRRLTETVRNQRRDARAEMLEAVKQRNWQAIAGLTVVYDKLESLSRTLDSMVEMYSKE